MGLSNGNLKNIYTFKLSKMFDCSLVERPFLKEKNSQCTFSHFSNRKVRKRTNQTIQHDRLSRLLIEKKSFFWYKNKVFVSYSLYEQIEKELL